MRQLLGGAVLGFTCAVFSLGGAGQTMEEVIYPEVPAGCVVTGDTGTDEGFPLAACEDGSYIYADMDGQPYENEAGYPVYPAGTWRDASGYVEVR